MEKYMFRYRFEPGKKISYRILIGGQIKVLTPMGEMKNPIGMEMGITQKILAAEDDGEAIVSVCIDNVRAEMVLDAKDLPECGKESLMKMDSLGKVRWVDRQAAWQGAEHSMMQFPEHSLAIDDSWVQQVEDASGSATPFYTRYVFSSLKKPGKRFATFSTELFTGHPEALDSEPAGRGIFVFDRDDGWIHSCESFIEYRFSMPLPEDPAIRITTETKLQITMKKL